MTKLSCLILKIRQIIHLCQEGLSVPDGQITIAPYIPEATAQATAQPAAGRANSTIRC